LGFFETAYFPHQTHHLSWVYFIDIKCFYTIDNLLESLGITRDDGLIFPDEPILDTLIMSLKIRESNIRYSADTSIESMIYMIRMLCEICERYRTEELTDLCLDLFLLFEIDDSSLLITTESLIPELTQYRESLFLVFESMSDKYLLSFREVESKSRVDRWMHMGN
jgi:hypothetical protein